MEDEKTKSSGFKVIETKYLTPGLVQFLSRPIDEYFDTLIQTEEGGMQDKIAEVSAGPKKLGLLRIEYLTPGQKVLMESNFRDEYGARPFVLTGSPAGQGTYVICDMDALAPDQRKLVAGIFDDLTPKEAQAARNFEAKLQALKKYNWPVLIGTAVFAALLVVWALSTVIMAVATFWK
jgi:hypothetical protein